MDDYYIGAHCAKCQQIDYLPFKCTKCNRSYCKDHRSHGCQIDSKVIDNQNTSKINTKKCPMNGCNDNLVISYKCNMCNIQYCIKHRHHLDHATKIQPINQNLKNKSKSIKSK